ncbi:MAG: chromosome segregation protein SMC [Anaerolineae bacterium]
MRLKQLELQGYKTFAAKTEFLFEGGLTAIIGPNGSGKSNVADAIQWVLGETTYGRLRAKRSEDMIFSGSNERARLGMAQASLTLDNADGWLPVDYGEVVIARRTYRSGENEYYLNGAKVRLRDISDLLAQSGLAKRTYTVIGQGLIDQALSLKPDERRALIEEAAGITGHQAKRATALRELEETRANLQRAQDILGEIEPRLRYLKVQARRAEERMQVQADLDTQLRIWYGHRWHEALRLLDTAHTDEQAARALVETRTGTLQTLETRDTDLRQRYTALRNQLGDWHRESSLLHRRAESTQRELAVSNERLRQLAARRTDMLAELTPLHARIAAQTEQVNAAEAARQVEQASLSALRAAIADTQSRLDQLENERRTRQTQLVTAQRRFTHLQNEIAVQERKLLEQSSRQGSLHEEHQRLDAELAAARANQAEFEPQMAALQARLADLAAQGGALADQRQALQRTLAQGEADLTRHNEQLATARRSADRLHDQLDLLQRLKDEGEGYSGGSRAIMRSLGDAKGSPLRGIIGAVADQLQVPAELELAIETALGGRLQDIIVEQWADAEQAINWLKRTPGGRATFLPLDTLRTGQPMKAPSGPGVVGLASHLVKAAPRLSKLVDYLLGRVVITRDLPTARRVLDSYPERPTVVTLEGDIVRPGGSVSGGSVAPRRDQGVLGRERALRELPEQMEQARQAVSDHEQQRTARQSQLQGQRQELTALEQQLATLARAEQNENAALAQLQGQAAQLAQQVRRSEQRLTTAAEEQASSGARAEQARQRLATFSTEAEQARQAVSAAEAAVAELDNGELTAELMTRRTDAGVVAARVASQQTLLTGQQRALAQLQDELRDKQTRAEALAADHAALQARVDAMHGEDSELTAQIDHFTALIDPAETELAQLESDRATLAAQEATERKHLQAEEQTHNRTLLALQRARDEMAHLRGEIEHDVGLVELEESEALDNQPPLPLRPLVERLPLVDALPDGIVAEIKRLRMQYSRLGSVNPNAPEEYAAAQERFEFLTSQSADLNAAAESLQQVVAELDEVMKREFMTTYRAVAREFKERFTTLFGGGTAQLVLTEPDDPMTSGIDIVARPPGKRVQALPLLSGGERSLTAAALILAILKVNPPPFCILDEVDAALDEANVDRFRAALREAAQQTQFIVITHNRGTIEAADTIYGITMGSDSVSQALSLHLEGAEGQRELVADVT